MTYQLKNINAAKQVSEITAHEIGASRGGMALLGMSDANSLAATKSGLEDAYRYRYINRPGIGIGK